MTRSPLLLRAVAVTAGIAALAGCSFRGSASDPDADGTSRSPVASSAVSSVPPSSPAAVPSSTSPVPPAPTSAAPSTPASTAPTSRATASRTTASRTTTPRTTAAGPAGGGTAVDRCHTSELTGSLRAGDAAAGNRYATLVLTDTGGQTCTVAGFGGLGLVDAAGHGLPTQQVRSGGTAPAVTLRPGAAVSSQLHWGAVPGTGDAQTGPCQPTPVTLRVIPPDETDALGVAWSGGPVCEGGTITQSPYVAG